MARTYATFSEDKIIGYITLVCGEVVIGDQDADLINDPDITYQYPHYPAVKIARLAVDQRHRGKGIGPTLVDLALGTARDVVSPAVGCRFVMVDSKKKSVDFI